MSILTMERPAKQQRSKTWWGKISIKTLLFTGQRYNINLYYFFISQNIMFFLRFFHTKNSRSTFDYVNFQFLASQAAKPSGLS